MDTPTYSSDDDEVTEPRIAPDSVPTGGGEALNLTVSSTSRGERSAAHPTGGGEMLVDLSASTPGDALSRDRD